LVVVWLLAAGFGLVILGFDVLAAWFLASGFGLGGLDLGGSTL
jgi:hypothetical protein